MSRTLSTNVTNGKAGDSIPVWLVEIEYGQPGDIKYLRYSTLGTADFPTAWSGSAFTANNLKRSGIGDIVDRCDVLKGGNTGDVGGLVLRLGNGSLISDTIDTYEFYNRRVEVRLIFADQTSPTWANAVPVFYGFAQFAQWDYDSLVLTVKGGWLARHKNVVNLQMTKALIPTLPDELEGEYFGVVYGDWFFGGTNGVNRRGIAYSGLTSSPYHHRDYIKGAVIRRVRDTLTTDGGYGYLALAEHELVANRNPDDIERVTKWNRRYGCFTTVEINDVTSGYVGVNNPDGTNLYALEAFPFPGPFDLNILLLSSLVSYEWLYLIPEWDEEASSATGISDPTYCTDESPSNRTTLSANNTDFVLQTETVNDDDGWMINSVKIYLERDGDETVDYVISGGGSASGTISTFGSTVSIALSDATPAGSAIKIALNTNQVGGAYGNVYVKHIHVALRRLITSAGDAGIGTELYQQVQGRMFHSFIDVGNHSNSYNAGNPIQNPPYVVESILCQELGLTPAGLARSVDFDGTNHLLVVKHSESLVLNDFTLIAWVNPDDFGTISGLLRKETPTDVNYPSSWEWWLEVTSGLPKLTLGNGSSKTTTNASASISSGTWTHIAVKVSGTTVTHYKNGATNGSGTNSNARTDASGDVIIGEAGGVTGPKLDGKLDEVKIYNRALTDAEILADYNSGSGLRGVQGESGLVANWHFDEGTGREFRDSSGNDNHAGSFDTAIPSWAAGKVESTQQILESSFDTVGDERTDWKFARQLTSPQNSRDIIAQLCYEGGFAHVTRPDGLEALSLIVPSGSPSTLTTADVKMNGTRPMIKVRRADPATVKNEFVLHYRKNMATGEYEKTIYLTNCQSTAYDSRFTNLSSDGDVYWQLCSDSFSKFRQVSRWEYNSEWIRHDTTAELFVKFMAAKLTRLPLIVEMETSLKHIGMSLFDQYLINHPLIPAAENATNHFLLVEQTIKPSSDSIALTFLDIGTP